MSRKLWAALFSVALATLCVSPSFLKAQPAAGELRVARLVRELGADSFAVRTQASEELGKLGAEARADIEAATRSDDPEVRLRAKDLLLAIKVNDLWSASRYSSAAAPLSASQTIQQLCEQTGNHLLVGDQFGAFHDADVQIGADVVEFWPVVDELCRQSGNHFRPHYDSRTPGVVLVAGPPGKQPVAYAGPVRARITSARRTFNEELSYDDTRSETTHTFQFNLEMTWEDRFKLVAYRSQPEVLEARIDGAQVAAGAQPAGGGWNVAGSGTRQLTMNLRINPPPATAPTLDTLRLAWGLLAVGDMVTLEVDDLASRQPHFQDDVELIVESCQAAAAGRYEVVVEIRRGLNLPEPQEILFQEHELELVDTTGQPFRKLGQSGTLADHGASLRATFVAEDESAKPQKLRFTYPRLRSQRDLEIVFRQVPLPTGKPE